MNKNFLILYIALTILLSFFQNNEATAEPLVVIVHPQNEIENISMRELAMIYQETRTRWSNSQTILKINYTPESAIRTNFIRLVFNQPGIFKLISPVTHRVSEGLIFSTPEEVINFVSKSSNAIGYIPFKNLNKSIKTIKIDAMNHTDIGYPLR